jgi:hypothetical protein
MSVNRLINTKRTVAATLYAFFYFMTLYGCASLSGSKFSGEYIVIVDPSESHLLRTMIRRAAPGSTFLLKDGLYPIDNRISIEQDGITIRSYSRNREKVIIDGRYRGYILHINASNATIADLSIKNARHHLVHVVGGAHHVTLSNLHLVDARQQFVKANPSGGRFCDYGTVQNCLFEMTEEGRKHVDTQYGGCYSGGIQVLSASGWRVQDNRFENIFCTNGGLPTHMVLFWQSSRDPIVQRNTIINCARGIGFGLGQKKGRRSYDDIDSDLTGDASHFGGVIRRNVIFGNIGRFFNTGIGIENAWNAEVLENIVYSTGDTFSAIDARFPASNPVIRNNLVNKRITVRDGAVPRLENNVVQLSQAYSENSGDR